MRKANPGEKVFVVPPASAFKRGSGTIEYETADGVPRNEGTCCAASHLAIFFQGPSTFPDWFPFKLIEAFPTLPPLPLIGHDHPLWELIHNNDAAFWNAQRDALLPRKEGQRRARENLLGWLRKHFPNDEVEL